MLTYKCSTVQYVSPLLYQIFNICKLHEIPYEMLHNGESCFRILRTHVYTKNLNPKCGQILCAHYPCLLMPGHCIL